MTPTLHEAYYTDNFFSKLEGDLSSESVGFKFSPEVRFPPSYVNLTSLNLLILCEHFSSMVVYFIASS